MAELTIANKLADIKTLFNKIDNIYLFKSTNLKPSAIVAADFEIPVISDGVNFNTGEPSVTKVKLTTGETWTTMAEVGDSDIKFQVGSIDEKVNNLFLNKISTEEETAGATIAGNTYKGLGYSLEPKKLKVGLLMLSEDRQTVIFLPNVEVYSSLVIDDSKPAYYNVTCTPLASADGISIYFLKQGEA